MYIWSACHGLYSQNTGIKTFYINKTPGSEVETYGDLRNLMNINEGALTNNQLGKCPLRCKLLHKGCHWSNDMMTETSRTG